MPVCHLEKRKEVERWRRDIYQATDLDIGATLQPVSATLPTLPPYIATLPSRHLTVMPSCHILITCNLFLTGRRTISYSAHGLSTFLSIMSEKLCLQWNDFQENVKSSFAKLRGTTDFILKKNKHSHPLIFMRGMKSIDLVALVDFLYFGEAKVFQENLDSFLAIAEELQLKGLQNSKDHNESAETMFFSPSTKLENNTSHITSNSIAIEILIDTVGFELFPLL